MPDAVARSSARQRPRMAGSGCALDCAALGQLALDLGAQLPPYRVEGEADETKDEGYSREHGRAETNAEERMGRLHRVRDVVIGREKPRAERAAKAEARLEGEQDARVDEPRRAPRVLPF